MMLKTKYQGAQDLLFQTRRFFFKFSYRKSIFSLCDLDMQQTRTIFVEGHPRIISAKLFQNWTKGLGGVVI